jgi:acetoacetyl-CoA synthetase
MEESIPVPRKLWEHPDPSSTQMYKFKQYLAQKTNQSFPDYE